MSQENVALSLRAYDAFNRREGLRRWWTDLLGAFPDYTVELEELRDLGDVTLGHVRASGQSAATEMPLVEPYWHAIEWRNAKCVWWRTFSSEAEALEALRLRGAADT